MDRSMLLWDEIVRSRKEVRRSEEVMGCFIIKPANKVHVLIVHTHTRVYEEINVINMTE